jgi:prepilin-type N-terminal cleavage/methylation domain-containing protein
MQDERSPRTHSGARRSRRNGFTLVEVVAATVVLGMLVIPLLGARNRTVAGASKSSTEFLVAQLAASKLSELVSVPLEDVERSGDFENAPGCSWEISVEPEDMSADEEELEEPVDEAMEPYLYRVKLVVKYPVRRKKDEISSFAVTTLVFKRESDEEEEEAAE